MSGLPIGRYLLLCAAFAALVAAGLGYSLHSHWSGDDDNTYLLLTGLNIVEGGEATPLLDEFLATAEAEGFREEGVASMRARRDNLTNYVLPSAVYGLAYRLLDGGGEATFGEHGAAALKAGFVAAALIALALALAFSVPLRPRVALAGLLTLTALLLLQHYAPSAAPTLFDWDSFVARLPLALANPGTALGPFGETPRSNLALLAVFVFLLRANGSWRSSYALVAIALLFHRQHGALLLGTVLVADFIVRPRVLGDRAVVALAGVGVLYVGLTEPALRSLGVPGWVAAVLLLAVFAAGIGLAALHARHRRREPSGPFTNALADLVVFAALFALIIAASLGARGWDLSGGQSAASVWPQLPGRFLGIVQPQIYIALAIALQRLIPETQRGPRVVRATVATGVAAIVIFAAVDISGSVPRIEARTAEVAARIDGNLRLAPLGATASMTFRDEERIYAALGAQLATGTPRFDQLVAVTPQQGAFPVIALNQEAAFQRILEGASCAFLTDPLTGGGPDGAMVTGTPFDAAIAWGAYGVLQQLTDFSAACGQPVPAGALCHVVFEEHLFLARPMIGLVPPAEFNAPCPVPPPAATHPDVAGPVLCYAAAHVGGIVGALLDAGASLSPPGGCGPTGRAPLDVAREHGNETAVRRLEEAMEAGR